MNSLTKLSEQLLLEVKKQKNSEELQQSIALFSFDELQHQLKTDNQKKTFWINVYNAYFLILRRDKGITKPKIYKEKLITIANNTFSLDDIEHGILRKYRYKFSYGYLPNIFAPKLLKQLAVSTLDYRIHFALNCGAKSCPPIAFYKFNSIDSQLDLATQSFLESETEFESDKVYVSSLFKWYLGDFKGKKGIRDIIKHQLNKDISKDKIVFKPYNWEEDLNNFTQ